MKPKTHRTRGSNRKEAGITTTMFVRHTVGNDAIWKRAYDDFRLIATTVFAPLENSPLEDRTHGISMLGLNLSWNSSRMCAYSRRVEPLGPHGFAAKYVSSMPRMESISVVGSAVSSEVALTTRSRSKLTLAFGGRTCAKPL
jgi:hypothetical protein